MKISSKILALGAVGLAAALPAHATGPKAGEWSGALSVGADFAASGDVHGGASVPVANLGPLNPALAGVGATLQIGSRSYKDVYGTSGWVVGGELGYGYSDAVEAFVRLNYGQLSGKRLQVGNAVVGAPVNATLPIYGKFDDRKAFGLTVGGRYWFSPGTTLRPFAGANIGLASLDAVRATFTIPGGGITIPNARFFKSSTVFTGGVEAGLGYGIASNIDLELAVSANYSGAPKADDTDLAGLGLSSINHVNARWSVPVTLGVRFKF